MGFKIGVCGAGGCANGFIPAFQAHPLVDEVSLAEPLDTRRESVAERNGIRRTFRSLKALLDSDCDAVAICTQRWLHGPQTVQALEAGKHVYAAVPAAITLEELAAVVEAVEQTRLIYMLGETSYYRPQTIYCRTRLAAGDFGHFVYGEGQYYHDMSHFYRPYSGANGPDWKRFASFPPMLYPTHSVAHVLSVTFRRMTAVSCFGFADTHEDGIFRAELSAWGNVFSNEMALFRTSDGGAARINELRRIVGTQCPNEGAALLRREDMGPYLESLGILQLTGPVAVEELHGGVSGAVFCATGGGRCGVLKQALPQLKMRAVRSSRVERSIVEARCAELLATLIPGCVLVLLAADRGRHALVMESAPGPDRGRGRQC